LDQNSEFVPTGNSSFFSRLIPAKWFAGPENSVVRMGEQTGGAIQLSKAESVALRNFRSRLTIKRDTTSHLVTATFSSHDPVLAALVTNTLVSLFIERGYIRRHDAIMESSAWLSKQLDDVRDAMQKSNAALAAYEQTWGIADLGDDNESTFSKKISELTQEFTQAQSERIQLEAYMSRVQSGSEASLQQVGNDPVIQSLTQKVADARTALSEAEVVYGSNHPNVRRLKTQISELEVQIATQRKAIVDRMRTSYAAAEAHEKLVANEVKRAMAQSARMGEYTVLKKEAQANRSLYDTLYIRVKEAGIAAEMKSSNIRVVDRAQILDIPTRPHRTLIVMEGLLVGIVGGILVAFLLGRFDTAVYGSEDIKKLTGIGGISMMPTFESNKGLSAKTLEPGFTLSRNANSTDANDYDADHFAVAQNLLLDRPGSPEAEALRGLQTSIMFRRTGVPQVIQIVSAFPGEGKTTIAANLAVALSGHSETCLIDADIRKPGIAQAFGLVPSIGLGEVLMGTANLETALIHPRNLKNLSLLPAKVIGEDPGHLFVSGSMRIILGELRRQFRQVVIDTPPLIAYADGRAIAPLADGLVLVGRYGVTTREAMAQTMELLGHMNAPPVIQVVLNGVCEPPFRSRYHYQVKS